MNQASLGFNMACAKGSAPAVLPHDAGAFPCGQSKSMPIARKAVCFQHLGEILACPCDRKEALEISDTCYACRGQACGRSFPVVNGVPILINDETSIFRVEDYVKNRLTTVDVSVTKGNRFKRLGKRLVRWVPSIGANLKAGQNIPRLKQLALQETGSPSILIVGSGMGDEIVERELRCPEILLVGMDVHFSPQVQMISDAHDLPFRDESLDAVICQSVLEHVADPYRCVQEIYRVLKPRGLVYAETPFMQPVHAKAFDFTRFTLGGHRRLFRNFEQIEAGAEGGPGMALAWSISWFFRSFSRSTINEAIHHFVVPFFTFWLLWFDRLLIKLPQASDASSELYFLGRKSETTISDREIVMLHWTRQALK